MRTILIGAGIAGLTLVMGIISGRAQTGSEVLRWPHGAPGTLGKAAEDTPSLTLYEPDGKAMGAGFIVCPGGGYGVLAPASTSPCTYSAMRRSCGT